MFNKIYNKKIILIAVAMFAVIVTITLLCNTKEDKIEIIEEFEEEENTDDTQQEQASTEKNVVHITGCVKNTGIVEVDKGARIADVIEIAGGVTEEADISKVNLAYIVKDAQKIYIPSIYDKEEIEYITFNNGDNIIIKDSSEGVSEMVNLNTATQAELEKLPGIGPSTALKIINYREKNGKFKTIEDIKQVPGIGDAKFNNIKEMIEV